ncbi:helix-turn-helix transcriptional regulator [Flammeovirga sp. EKP202]|uniref:helix-turn-helix transcriptional regulator n=1 Tax=Flammeovirga sp. EKP202 TaxID=2770592 RepID=UPI00165EC55B|nr:AraC family transcriptional regulator [Flammeovirga sp. EKP202]MBD0404761.1 helix-turn-helix transcriptional regulator [Flammeovirga sp. EKP202]
MDFIIEAGNASVISKKLCDDYGVEENYGIVEVNSPELNIFYLTLAFEIGVEISIAKGRATENVHLIRKANKYNDIIPLVFSNMPAYHSGRNKTPLNNNTSSFEISWSNTKDETYIDIPKGEDFVIITFYINRINFSELQDSRLSVMRDLLDSDTPFTFYHFCPHKIQVLLKQIVDLEGDYDWMELMIKCYGYNILAEFLLLIKKVDTEQHTHYHQLQLQRVLDIKKYILKNLDEELSLKHLSEQFFISESSIQKDFKRVYDQTPHQFIKEERLEKAKDLLQNSSFAINQIAFMLRYKNPSHFSSSIKKKFGLLPKSLRAVN